MLTAGKLGENASIVNIKSVLSPTVNNSLVGCVATNPVISPLLNNTKLGGSEPDVTLYYNTTSETALTFNVLITSL